MHFHLSRRAISPRSKEAASDVACPSSYRDDLQHAQANAEHWDRLSSWPTHRVRWFIAQAAKDKCSRH